MKYKIGLQMVLGVLFTLTACSDKKSSDIESTHRVIDQSEEMSKIGTKKESVSIAKTKVEAQKNKDSFPRGGSTSGQESISISGVNEDEKEILLISTESNEGLAISDRTMNDAIESSVHLEDSDGSVLQDGEIVGRTMKIGIDNQNGESVAEDNNNADSMIKEHKEDQKIDKVEHQISTSRTHASWQKLLSQYVSVTGGVDYEGFKKNEAMLDQYLEMLKTSRPKLSDRSDEAKVYWINAYNANTVKLILMNYPVSSITDIENGQPWDKKWVKLDDDIYSLNNIEHDILRPYWNDARIHFAVNCAAQSCPPLSSTAFTSSNVDMLLESLTRSFINDEKNNSIHELRLSLSKIFQWYEEDFGDVISFIDRYTHVSIEAEAELSYRDYDWSLNKK